MGMGGRVLVGLLLVFGGAVRGDESGERHPVVIDTDMGVDDAVTLALALQSPDVDLVAIVAVEGASGGEKAVGHLEQMLELFNRADVPLYAGAGGGGGAPAFRGFAEESVGRALGGAAGPRHRPFSADAYGGAAGVTVLALGPLTNLAAALRAKPEIKDRIARVIVAGANDPRGNWNLAYDAAAGAEVRASGVRIEFVAGGGGAAKPAAWRQDEPALGPGTSLGEDFIRRLLGERRVREHYVGQWPGFSDELVLLYGTHAELFVRSDESGAWTPRDSAAVLAWFTRSLGEGRQRKQRVVFEDGTPEGAMLQPDLRQRRDAIIAKNGEVEWFVELLTNELHDHLGVYSVIGAKMGLRAAELLNAPPHELKVASHSAAWPPVSCLNDGVIVATGSTPGRGLFAHTPEDDGSTRVRFSYQEREVQLSLKPEYQQRIAAEIKRLIGEYGLARHEYWDGVRKLSLDVWEDWHRREIFEVRSSPAASRPSEDKSGR